MNKRETKEMLNAIICLEQIKRKRRITCMVSAREAYIPLSTVLDYERVRREFMKYIRG